MNLEVNDLVKIIGEQTLEIRGVREMLRNTMKRITELEEENAALQKQIGADNGEPT